MEKNYPNTAIIKVPNTSLGFLKKHLFFIFAFFALTTGSFAQITDTYTTSGTFTVPTGVTSITIDCIGAGGAGGSARGNNNEGAGGGAGGQYARSTITVSAGQIYVVTVAGTTLAPINNDNIDGATGGFSEVTRSSITHARANGGAGGIRANGSRAGGAGNTTGAIGNIVVRSGGNGGNGTASGSGAGGGGAGTTANGGNASGTTAGTGATLLGGNGAAGFSSAANTSVQGSPGFNYGGGGSGGRRDNTGGNGAQGYVQITYTLPACVTPSTQPTALVLTPTTTTIAGSFTASATANGYLIVRTTTATAPTNPTNGTVYTAGATALGGTIVQSSNATTFTDSPLVSSTQYWYWVFAYNSGCTGQPRYLSTSPLTNNTTTLAAPLIVPTTGNNAYTTCSGLLYDNGGSGGNYVNNSNGYTVINPSIPGNFAQVQGIGTANIENNFDFINIYNGVGIGGTLLYSGTGIGITIPLITSASGSLTVQFTSDGSITASGFALNISCSTTPGSPYCIPSTTQNTVYISGLRSVGTLADASNIPTNYSTGGYGNFTGITIASQAPLGPVNIEINLTGDSQFIKTYVDWNKDGVFNETNELVYNTGTIATGDTTYGFIIPAGTLAGNYRMRVKTRAFISSASTTTPCNSYDRGETEDYTLKIVADCAAKITSVTDGFNCGNGTVTLGAVGTSGTTGFNWYANSNDTVPITTTGSGSWTTPSLTTTTTYYVTAINASPCESLIKTPVRAIIRPTTNISFTPVAPIICGDNTIITISATGDTEELELINEGFEDGLSIFSSTTPTNTNGGVDTPWSVKTSTYQPTTTTVFRPALSSGTNGNRFAFTTSDYQNSNIETNLTTTASINTNTFTTLTLTFRHYYSYFGGDSGRVQVSTDGGASWTTLPGATYVSDIGSPSKFENVTIGMNAYVGQSNLRIRFNYRADWDDGWAIDDIRLFGTRPLTTAFTWSGATVDAYVNAAATIPYTTQSVSTLYIKPTAAQLELNSWTFTGTVTLSNGCSVSSPLTVTNNTKVWQGVTTNWNTASNWKPDGIPSINNCVVIPNNTVISGTNYNAYGKNLIVKNGGTLNIQPDNNLTIADGIIVEAGGIFQVENNSNLVQINNIANTGNIIYKRIAPGIRGSDYVYWSSPVAGQDLNSIYTSPTQGPKYYWNPTVDNGNGTGGNISTGNYINANGATMGTGIGYIVRGSSSSNAAATNINSTFTGRPNNGTIPVSVSRGNYVGPPYTGANGAIINNLDDNYNLIGNPYPSAINALRFIFDNSAVIEGNVKLWTHGTSPGLNNGGTITNPFYGTFAYNYSAGDYMTINYSGATIPTASESIKAGQAFFVEMLDGPAGSGTVNFNNLQRRDGSGVPYANDGFFKNSNQQITNLDNLERHRIWLDILNSNDVAERTLLGYIEGATMNTDSGYDALASTLTMGIYSILNNENFVIQGRSLPFDDNDQVTIGFNVPSAGTYKIGINTVDGLFLGAQEIYLKDELLNIYHNLKLSQYSFTATAGIHNNRFKLVYKNTVLSNVTFNENEIQIAKNNNIIDIVSGNEIMENVKVFDLRGRLIVEKTKINSNTISIDVNAIQDQVLIVNIVTSEGIKVTRKIL